MEEDKSKNCMNYPGGGYTSYRECNDLHLRSTLAALVPGLNPIWLPGPIGEVTSKAQQTDNLTGDLQNRNNVPRQL